ncbi:Rpn family recombination-promoting nuclease/putative transposase [Flavitalea flava]
MFGSEPNKDLLISFLNALFKGKKVIIDLAYNKNEVQGPLKNSRKSVYDLTCTGQDGEQFIIEIQRAKQKFFKDRAVFYTSTLIQELGQKGTDWNFELKEVYLVALMEFCFDDTEPEKYLHQVFLTEAETCKTFYDKLGYIFIELPNFNKAEQELETDLDRWLFVFKNMSKLHEVSAFLRKPIFEKLFSVAAVSNLSKEEYMQYSKSQWEKWDKYATLQYAKDEGFEAANIKTIKNMILKGKNTVSEIADIVEVPEAFVQKIKDSLQ